MQPEVGNEKMKSKGRKYLLLTIVFLVISVLSFWFVYKYFNDESGNLSVSFLTVPVILQLGCLLIIYFLLDTLRFYYVLRTFNIKVSFLYILKLSFINIFVSSITPFVKGGGVVQVYFLHKRDKSIAIGDATAASAIRTLLPMVFFFITVPFVLLMNNTLLSLFPGNHAIIYVSVIILIGVLFVHFGYKILKNTRIVKYRIYKMFVLLRRKKFLSHKRIRKMCLPLFKEINSFATGFHRFFTGSKKNVILSIIFTLLYLLSLFLIPVILIRAMNYDIPILSIIAIQMVITFITHFAITPGGSGIVESGFALMFASIINRNDIVSLTLTWRFFSTYLGVIIGIVLFYSEIFKRSKYKKGNYRKDNN